MTAARRGQKAIALHRLEKKAVSFSFVKATISSVWKSEKKDAVRLTDEQAKAIIKLCSGRNNATEFEALLKAEQERNIEEIKNRGLSVRQVSRLRVLFSVWSEKIINT